MRPSQKLKSPTTDTARADGAQTLNAVPADAVDLAHVRAEPRPQLLVAALADQVQVELADRRQEAVRVVDRDRPGLAVVDLELVGERQLGALDDALEHAAGMHALELDRITALGDGPDGRRAGRNARITTPPSAGCAPRMSCGLECSRRTRRSRSGRRQGP